MKLAHLNANLLVALDLLLSHQSVQRAAEQSGVTASAMSHSLRSLRELFDDPILTRTSRGMVPTPFAERLRGPLRRALRDLERAVTDVEDFDPRTAHRGFVVAAPDFPSARILPPLLGLLEREAPGIDVEVRPLARAGRGLQLADLASLADGDVDLVLAAAIAPYPAMCVDTFYEERFVCVVREGHPEVGAAMDLETYARLPHVLITITDERSPTWIDDALAEHGLARRVTARTRYFGGAPLLVAESDHVLTCPEQLARYFAARLPLRVLEPPLPLPTYPEQMIWHERYDADPGSRWLRDALRRAEAETRLLAGGAKLR